ncbi:MAG: hypothetical protein R2911_27880 [Caldilineaceae bacterium]
MIIGVARRHAKARAKFIELVPLARRNGGQSTATNVPLGFDVAAGAPTADGHNGAFIHG